MLRTAQARTVAAKNTANRTSGPILASVVSWPTKPASGALCSLIGLLGLLQTTDYGLRSVPAGLEHFGQTRIAERQQRPRAQLPDEDCDPDAPDRQRRHEIHPAQSRSR